MSVKKEPIVLALLLVALGVGAYFVHRDATADANRRPAAQVYAVPGDFLVALRSGHEALVDVALVLPPGSKGLAEAVTTFGGVGLPDAKRTAQRDARIRAVIGGVLTGQPAHALMGIRSRRLLQDRIRDLLARGMHLYAAGVLFTDVTVR
jgi:hypothetical protein